MGIIQQLLTVSPIEPLLCYPMTEPSGLTVRDVSENEFHGKILRPNDVDVGLNFGIYSTETCYKFYPTGNVNWHNNNVDLIRRFNPNEMTFGIFIKVLNSAIWTDGESRRVFILKIFQHQNMLFY